MRPRRSTPAFPHGAPTSDVPPPPAEAAPIPLVRKAVSLASDPAAEPEQDSSELTERPPNYGPVLPATAIPTFPPLRTPRFAITAPPPFRGNTSSAPPTVTFPSFAPSSAPRCFLDRSAITLGRPGRDGDCSVRRRTDPRSCAAGPHPSTSATATELTGSDR